MRWTKDGCRMQSYSPSVNGGCDGGIDARGTCSDVHSCHRCSHGHNNTTNIFWYLLIIMISAIHPQCSAHSSFQIRLRRLRIHYPSEGGIVWFEGGRTNTAVVQGLFVKTFQQWRMEYELIWIDMILGSERFRWVRAPNLVMVTLPTYRLRQHHKGNNPARWDWEQKSIRIGSWKTNYKCTGTKRMELDVSHKLRRFTLE